MPQFQYPFIDIAVHPAVRVRFAAGDAIALFSPDMASVLWANGEGAGFFGYDDIYGLLDNGPNRSSVSFRQLAAAAAQLREVGDRQSLIIRTTSGFQSATVTADVSLVEIRKGETVVIFSAPVTANAGSNRARIASMLRGFDDPDTHMAVLDGEGNVLAASIGFNAIGVSPETARSLIASLRYTDGLIKRPIATSAGYLPAAIGTVAENPPLHLLFCVETVLGRMDPPHEPVSADLNIEQPGLPQDVEPAADGLDPDETELAADEAQSHDVQLMPPEDFLEAEPQAAFEDIEEAEDHAELAALDGMPADAIEVAAELLTSTDQTELAADEAQSHDVQLIPPEDFLEAETEADFEDIWEAEDHAEVAALDGIPADETAEDAGAGELEARLEPATMSEEPAPAFAPNMPSEEAPLVSATRAEPEATGNTAPVTADAVPAIASFMPSPDATAPFVFRREGRPVRFVWKLDAQGRFAEVSDEFARTVGPHSGDINGLPFQELAYRFHLDADGEIGRLLERRDTWSGRMIRWPVEGTNLVVPVDLAALPTYSRNREFDGFRGFGIIRVGDAEEDPDARGLTIGMAAENEIPIEVEVEDVSLTVDDQFDDTAPSPEAQMEAAEERRDEFQGETPALNIVSNPLAAFSDKIVQLEERRNKAREGLTQAEQNALKEIARQLEPFGKRPNELVAEAGDATNPDTIAEDSAEEPADSMLDSGLREVSAEPPAQQTSEEDAPAAGDVHAEQADDLPASADEVVATIDRQEEGPGLTAYAIDQVPVAILIHAGDRLIQANSEFRRFSFYDNIEALEAAGGLDSLISRREGADGGVYMVRADGTQLPVAARLQSVRYEGTTALMLTLMPESVAAIEEPYAEDELAAHKYAALQVEADELRAILETATDGVVVLDTDGRIRSMNRSASALFNFDDKETRGKPFAMLFAHESQKAVQDYVVGLAGHGVASVLNDGREVIGREASGGFIPLFMTMGRMAASNTYCAVMRDITQWKRSEEELRTAKRSAETANQHKSDFLARVSHEIRTPLNAIIGFSDMIASEHFGPAGHPRYVEYAHDIGRSGRHVLDIVNDLLDISKIEAGEMDVEFAAVGLNDCISEAVSLVQPQANAQRVIIRTSLSQSVPEIVADLRSIKQIAINILANAIRFTPSGGQIVVSTAYEQTGSVTLRIRDTGVGMSKSELEQAMKPFGQVSPGTRKRGDGTGLGLPLTKAMTEANRALFSIQSAPNEGTLVEITFPPQRVLAD